MITNVSNSQPSFGMAMFKVPAQHNTEFAKIVNATTNKKKKGLDKFIKRAGKNPHYNILFTPANDKGLASMAVLDSKGNRISNFVNNNMSRQALILTNLGNKFDNSGFFGKISAVLSAQIYKLKTKTIHQDNFMPNFMMDALELAEKKGQKKQNFIDMVKDTTKILEKNADKML